MRRSCWQTVSAADRHDPLRCRSDGGPDRRWRRDAVGSDVRRVRPQRRAPRRRSTPDWPPAIAADDRARRPAARRARRPAPAGAAVRLRALVCCSHDPRRPARRAATRTSTAAPRRPAIRCRRLRALLRRARATSSRSCWHPQHADQRDRPLRAVAAGVRACSPPRSGRSPTSTSAPAPGSTCSLDRYHYRYEPGGAVRPADASGRLHVRHRGGGARAGRDARRFAAAVGLDRQPGRRP